MSQNLLLSAAKSLDISDDISLLAAVGDTVAKAAQLTNLVRGVTNARDIIEKLAAGADNQEIKAAFSAAGLPTDFDTLVKFITKLVDTSNVLQPKYQPLLDTLETFAIGDANAQVSWTISTNNTPLANGPGYGINLGASATLALNAAAKWADPGVTDQFLSLGANGDVSAGASATIPYPYGTIQIGGQAKTALALGYFFKARPTEIFALAVASRLADLADPFDLDSVWAQFKATDLQGLTYEFDGTANVQVQVSLADAAALGAGVVANLGASVGVSVSATTKYFLSLYKAAAPDGSLEVKVQLSRSPVLSTDFNGSVGLDVDLSALTKPVLQAMTTATGQWEAVLATIQPFLSPGTWLRNQATALLDQQVAALIGDPSLRAAMIADLKGAIGAEAVTDSALADWLSTQITGAIDRGSVLIDANAAGAAGRVLANLQRATPGLASAAANQIATIVDADIATLATGLKAAVQQLIAVPQAALVAALAKVGAIVNQDVTKLDGALAVVRNLLNQYDSKFHSVMDAAEAALKQKVSARFYFDETTSNGAIVEVDGIFNSPGAHSRSIFRALTLGNFQTLVSVVDGQMASPNFTLDKAKSSVTRFSRTGSNSGFEIAFLNFDLKGSEVIAVDATSLVDGFGNVHVNTSGSLAKTIASPFNTRAVSFVDTSALVLAGALQADAAAGLPVLELGIGATFARNSLTWNDVANFIQGLAQAGLVSAKGCASAKTTFDGWSQLAGAGGKIGGSLAASLRLTGPQIATLLRIADRAPATGLSPQARLAIITSGLSALRSTGAIDVRDFENGAQNALGLFQHPFTSIEDIVLNYPTQIGVSDRPPDGEPPSSDNTPAAIDDETDAGQGQSDYVDFLQEAYGLLQLVDLIDAMGGIYQSKANGMAGQGGWTAAHYAAAQQKLVNDSGAWLTVIATLENLFNSKITPRTVAFMRAITDLAGLVDQPGVIITMTCQAKQGELQTAAFG